MLTRRGWAGLVGGIGAYLVAWGFGAAVLVPLAVALVIAPLASLLLHRRHRHEHLRLAVSCTPMRPIEGTAFTCTVRLDGRAPRGGRLRLRLGPAELAVPLQRVDGFGTGAVEVAGLPRGVHRVDGAALAAGDPFGLVAAGRTVSGGAEVIVWPRWRELGDSADGAVGEGELARRSRGAPQVGYDLHGIREHQEGESLRRVDWKTTARTGRLMVRELEDGAGADQVIVVDLDRALLVGDDRPELLDRLVRAAATAVRAAITGGRRTTLLLAGDEELRMPLEGGAHWHAAMDALAGAQADRALPLADLLARDRALLAGSAITVITASTAPTLVAALEREAERVPVLVAHVPGADRVAWPQRDGAGPAVIELGDVEPLARAEALA